MDDSEPTGIFPSTKLSGLRVWERTYLDLHAERYPRAEYRAIYRPINLSVRPAIRGISMSVINQAILATIWGRPIDPYPLFAVEEDHMGWVFCDKEPFYD